MKTHTHSHTHSHTHTLTHTHTLVTCHSARLALASSVKEIRAGALRVLRYVLTSKDIFTVMLKHRVDLLVARSLDVSSAREIERMQAMRFVRQVSVCCAVDKGCAS